MRVFESNALEPGFGFGESNSVDPRFVEPGTVKPHTS